MRRKLRAWGIGVVIVVAACLIAPCGGPVLYRALWFACPPGDDEEIDDPSADRRPPQVRAGLALYPHLSDADLQDRIERMNPRPVDGGVVFTDGEFEWRLYPDYPRDHLGGPPGCRLTYVASAGGNLIYRPTPDGPLKEVAIFRIGVWEARGRTELGFAEASEASCLTPEGTLTRGLTEPADAKLKRKALSPEGMPLAALPDGWGMVAWECRCRENGRARVSALLLRDGPRGAVLQWVQWMSDEAREPRDAS